MDESLRIQWRDEARKAVSKAAIDGETRGREAATEEFEALEFKLRERIKELEVNVSTKGTSHKSHDQSKKNCTKRAKAFLSGLYVKVQGGIGNGDSLSKGDVLKSLKSILIDEVDSLDNILQEVSHTSTSIKKESVQTQDVKCQTDFKDNVTVDIGSTSDLSSPSAYRPSLVNEPPPLVYIWPDVSGTEQRGEGVFGLYVTYSILTHLAPNEGSLKLSSRRELASIERNGQSIKASRRFSEFVSLRDALTNNLPRHSLVVIPNLPKQKLGERLKGADVLVWQRRVRLGLWLQHVSGHPILAHARPLSVFCCTSLSAVPSSWRNAIDTNAGTGDTPLIDANIKRGGLDVDLTQNQQKALGARLVTTVIKETIEEATVLQGLLEKSLDNEKRLAEALNEAGDSMATLHKVMRGDGWKRDDVVPLVAPAVEVAAKAAHAVSNATLLHCTEPLRFHARPCLESAISLLDRFKRLSDEHLDGVDVSKEWRQLGRLRGAALTLGMADAVRVAQEEARKEQEAWASVATQLEDSVGVAGLSFTSELEAVSENQTPTTEANNVSSETPIPTPTPTPSDQNIRDKFRTNSVSASISSFFQGSETPAANPKLPNEDGRVPDMDDAYRSRAEAFAKTQADNEAEKRRLVEERRAEAQAAMAEAEEMKRAKRSAASSKPGTRLKRRDSSLDPVPRTRKDSSLDPVPRTRKDSSLDPVPRSRTESAPVYPPDRNRPQAPPTGQRPAPPPVPTRQTSKVEPETQSEALPSEVVSEAVPEPQSVSNLPLGWEEVTQADGSVYYYHKRSRMSRWEKPDPQMALDIEERMNAEQAATDEAVARRREEMDAATAERDAISAKSELLKRSAEKSVQNWVAGRPLPVLLGDLVAIYPHAPPLPVPEEGDIKKVYMKAARAIHPDKVKVGSPLGGGGVVDLEMAVLAEVIFTVLSALYESHRDQ